MPRNLPLHAAAVSDAASLEEIGIWRDLEADVARARKTPRSDESEHESDHKKPPDDNDDDEAPETPTDEPPPVPIQDPPSDDRPKPPMTVGWFRGDVVSFEW